MTRLDHDFVRRRGGLTVTGMMLLLTGLGTLCAAAQQYLSAARGVAELERTLDAKARTGARAVGVSGPDLEQLRARIALANQVVRQRTLPWDQLFRNIEEASSSNIGVLAIQPQVASRQVRITGEALDAAALSDYITRLADKPALQHVHLVEHEVRQEQGRPVLRFSISAKWAAGAAS